MLAAGSIGAMIPAPAATAAGTRFHRDDRPRYFVFVFLSGGIDAVHTTDPKTRAEVGADIDIPYKPGAIKELGTHRVGPHLAMMGDAVKDLTIINGVDVHVLNHISGVRQFLHMKLGADGRMPTISTILGSQRDTQPVGELYVDVAGSSNGVFAPHFLGSVKTKQTDFFQLVEATSPEDLRRLARVYRGKADGLRRSDHGSGEIRTTATNIADCARFFDRVADLKPMKLEAWDPAPSPTSMSKSLQRVLWALENDLSTCVFTEQAGWDTHQWNVKLQTSQANDLYPSLGKFFQALHTRSNRHGVLADNTVVVIASELGRFPKLNQFDGKDHWPEAPHMLFGKRFRRGMFGATGKSMEGLPISFETGLAKSGGNLVTLDDLSATLLEVAGIEPRSYGYTGRQLEFLVE